MTRTLSNLLLALSVLFPLSETAMAYESHSFGAGILLGAPTAISGKYWINHQTAADMGISISTHDYNLFFGDYLMHYPGLLGRETKFVSQLVPYLGVGVALAVTTTSRTNDDGFLGKNSGALGLGVRVPFGIEWQPGSPPIGVFLEIVPGISVVPETDVIFEGGIGIRYYF